jgi:hypothetical protein
MIDEDQPLSAKGAYTLAEEAPEVVEEENKDEGPIESRLASKVWKTRATAFEEFKQLITSDSSDPLPSFEASFINDTNPASQEKALDACIELLKSPKFGGLDDKALVKVVVDKAITSTRGNIKGLGTQVLIELFAGK